MMVVGGISTSDVGSDNEYRELKITSTGEALVRGTVTIGNSVTIGSLPAISGTVTANGGDFSAIVGESMPAKAVAIGFYSGDDAGIAQVNDSNRKMPISGTVTVGNSVTIGSLPAISGTVTANLSISSTVITSGSFSSLSSATLVPENPARKMATVFNLGAGQLFINAGATATTLGGGFMVALSSGDFYECDYTTTTLSAIFATAGTASWMSH
jgi:carbonic anhydrase/acetyltransferase-like protein (isoleucine patch superfamily)